MFMSCFNIGTLVSYFDLHETYVVNFESFGAWIWQLVVNNLGGIRHG